jgi:hypothetical protein
MADVRTVAADSTATEVHVDLVCNIDLFQEKYSAIQSWKSGCVNLQSAALTVSGFVPWSESLSFPNCCTPVCPFFYSGVQDCSSLFQFFL